MPGAATLAAAAQCRRRRNCWQVQSGVCPLRRSGRIAHPSSLPPSQCNARPETLLSSQLECRIPFKLDNPGLLCLAMSAAPTAEEPHRVALSLANLGTKAVPAGFDLRFAVQLGPA